MFCRFDLPLSFTLTSSVIATTPRCHLDRRERSHAAIIRLTKGIPGNTRFLAPLRNDSGGGITPFALTGTTGNVIATFP